jgi:spermidine/putrescine transport system substrate-binding protein
MTKGLAWMNLSWSGDAQWAIDEAAEVGIDLKYEIPSEGSAVWFDGWVIPKYAVNVKAASYFINFMCMPENALRNMDMTGYVSAVGGQEVLENMADDESYEAVDASYFFGEEADSVHVNRIMYPDKATITRCAMMHDTDTEALLKMWSRVKGANASAWTYILIIIVLGGLITLVILKYIRKAHRRKAYSRKRK